MAEKLTKVELKAKLHELGVEHADDLTNKELEALIEEAEAKLAEKGPADDQTKPEDEQAKKDEAIIEAAKEAARKEALIPREVRELVVLLPNGVKRSYSEQSHGKVWKILANNYKEAWDGKFV